MTSQVIKWLLSLAKPLRAKMAMAILLGVISNLAVVSIPLLGTYAVCRLDNGEPVTLWMIISLMLVCGVVRGVARYGEQYLNHDIAFRLLAIVRDRLFSVIRTLGPDRLSRRKSGDLVANVTTDVEALEVFFAHTISPVMIALLTSLVTVGYMATINWVAALFLLFGHVMVGIVYPLMGYNRYQQTGNDLQQGVADLNQVVMENVAGLSDIDQYGLQVERLTAIDDAGAALNRAYAKKNKQGSDIQFQSVAAIFLLSFAVFVQSWHVGLPASQLAMAVILSLSSFGPVLALAGLGNALLTTLASGQRLYGLITEKPQVVFLDSSKPEDESSKQALSAQTMPSMGSASFNHVSYQYPDSNAEIIDNLSFSVERHQSIGIGGPSGSGKSTVLKLMQRFFDPTSGTIALDQKNLVDWQETPLRHTEGVMAQTTFLFEDTIKENIAIGKHGASDDEIKEAAQKAELDTFISSLPEGYDTKIGPISRQLSDGERQRIGLARLFLQDAPLLLLDEPTSNLDYLNEQLIMTTIAKTATSKAMILFSHRPTTLMYADRQFVLEDGKLSQEKRQI